MIDYSFYIRNIFFFIVAITSFITLYDNNIVNYIRSVNLVTYYAIFDLIFYKLNVDLIIHHLLVIYIYVYNYFYGALYNIECQNKMFELCLYFEISSIFMFFQTLHDKLVPKKR